VRASVPTSLEATIAQLEATLESTHDGIVVVGNDRRFVRCNRRFIEMFGFPSDMMARANAAEMIGFVADQLDPADAGVLRSDALWQIDAGPPQRMRFKDGRVFERFVCPQRIGEAVVGRVISYRDVSESLRQEEQLRQLQKMEAIGRLAGGVAHDLNNALTAISGFAELALGAMAADHPARPDVDEVRRGAERAASVTRQLLAFSRRKMLETRRFDANDSVASMARLLSRVIGPEVRVTVSLADDPLVVIGDPGQVEQAILNLALNAKDAMPNGGELTLSATFERVDEAGAKARIPMPPGTYVVVRVADTGSGMPPETQARAFEPFFTTKGPGKGTGLGLSMVYGTMKQAGGFVFVASSVGRGTTIELYFPHAPAQPEAETARRAARGGETVLVVDDEPAVRTLVASTLREVPVKLLIADSAEEALAIAGAHAGAIDLLLTDAVMPGRSGIELARLLVSERPGLRVMIMSGYAPDSIGIDQLPQPVDVLQKPFSPGDLRARIRRALDR